MKHPSQPQCVPYAGDPVACSQVLGAYILHNAILRWTLQPDTEGHAKKERSGCQQDEWIVVDISDFLHTRKYPKHPQASHPLNLLYGRLVRGYLDVPKEIWEKHKTPDTHSIVSHVLQMRDEMVELVWANLEQADQILPKKLVWQGRQTENSRHNRKSYFYCHGEQATRQVSGALYSTQKCGPATYEFEVPGKRKHRQTFHANLFKKWTEWTTQPGLQHSILCRGGGESRTVLPHGTAMWQSVEAPCQVGKNPDYSSCTVPWKTWFYYNGES